MFCQGRRPRPTSPTIYLTQRSRRTSSHFSTDPTPAQGNITSNSHGICSTNGKTSAKLGGINPDAPSLPSAYAEAPDDEHFASTSATAESPVGSHDNKLFTNTGAAVEAPGHGRDDELFAITSATAESPDDELFANTCAAVEEPIHGRADELFANTGACSSI